MEQPEIERHPLLPFLPNNSRLLMLGSFPPQQKRWSMNFFYPNPQNDMWRIFGLLMYGHKDHFFNSKTKRFCQTEIESMLKQAGIALYDTAMSVRRLKGNASDEFLEIVEPTDIRSLLARIPSCHTVASTGGKSAQEVCLQLNIGVPRIGEHVVTDDGITFWRMPSSSRSYPLKLEKKAEFYRRMLHSIGIIPAKNLLNHSV